jgi:acyl carrier protein
MTAPSPDPDISQAVIQAIAQVTERPADELTPGTTLDEDLDMDSVTQMEVTVKIEKTTGIRLSDTALETGGMTIADVCELVTRSAHHD